jgi:hypothetical protein
MNAIDKSWFKITSKRVTIENYVYLQTDDSKGHSRQRSKEHGPMKSSIPIGEEL